MCNIANLRSADHIYSSVSLKTKVNRPIMQLDGKNNICIFMLDFCGYLVLKWDKSIFN